MDDGNPNQGASGNSRPISEDEERLRERTAKAIAAGGGISVVASLSGLPIGTLSKYTARSSTASFMNAVKIASAAGVSLDEIAFGDADLIAREDMKGLEQRLRAMPWLPAPVPQRPSPDLERLSAAIEAVEAGLGGRQIPAPIKAELTIAAYDLLTEVTAESRARVMRLVKGG